MSCCDDYDRPDVSTYDRIRARKPHTCEECAGTIAPGEHYFRYVSLFEGIWSRMAICETCTAWGDAFRVAAEAHDWCDCWELGSLWSAISSFMRHGFDPRKVAA